jgi:hypothetical protein
MSTKSIKPTLKLRNWTVFVLLGLFSPLTSIADIQDVSRALHSIRIEREEALRPVEDDLIRLNDEKTILEAKLKELEAAKAMAAKKIESQVTTETLDSILLGGKLGTCKVERGELEREYIITDNGVSIRFIYAPFDGKFPPVAQLVKTEDGLHAVEIEQKGFNPAKPTELGEMKSTLRFDPETLKPVHAVFRGEKVNDQMFGYKSSHALFHISCVL